MSSQMTEAQVRNVYEVLAAIIGAREGVDIRVVSIRRRDDTKDAAPDAGTSEAAAGENKIARKEAPLDETHNRARADPSA